MSTTTDQPSAPAAAGSTPAAPRRSPLAGRGELAVVAVLLALAAFLTHGLLTMTVPPTAGSPGPRFFPTIVTGLAYALAALLTWQILRRPAAPRDTGSEPATAGEPATDEPAHPTGTDWRTVGIVVGTFLLFTAALEPVGWLLSAALLFWGVAHALDRRRPLFDASLALAVSAVVQLAFSAGLGLALPAGILEGAL
ncbi:tripartite tricarboxylate transporter TctB family protein [Streptomyces mayteni]